MTHSRRRGLRLNCDFGCTGTDVAAGLEFPNTRACMWCAAVTSRAVAGAGCALCILWSNTSFARSVYFIVSLAFIWEMCDPLHGQTKSSIGGFDRPQIVKFFYNVMWFSMVIHINF